MSDFSNKCREYLKDTGENVYQLSASSGLDRTSLQRMITGKRLPGIDFVRQFCDSLRINPCLLYTSFSACLNCFRVTVHSVLSNTLRDVQNLC